MDEDFPESPPLSSPLPEEHRPDTKPAIPLAPVNAPESGNALATEAAQTWIVSAETSLVDNVGTDLVPKEQGTESDCATASDVNGIAGGGAEESWEGPPTQWMSSADLPKELISESVPTAREEPVEPPSVMMPTPTDPVLSAAPVLPTVPTGALPVSTLPAVQTERITEDDSVRWKSLPSASIPEHLFVPSPPTEFREETLMRPDSGDALMDAPRRATAPRATGLDYIAQRRHVTSLKLVIIIGAAMLIISTLAVAQIFFG